MMSFAVRRETLARIDKYGRDRTLVYFDRLYNYTAAAAAGTTY